ncbi:MAG TPA: hypothetical protein VM223_01525 [Planctomycetota bacterium]|nr:hypothetical protein [Planctomycetota bacterium]
MEVVAQELDQWNGGDRQLDAGLHGRESGQRGEQQPQHAVEAVDVELLVGPVIRRLPVDEVDVLHVLECLFDGGEAAIGDDVGGGPIAVVGDEK